MKVKVIYSTKEYEYSDINAMDKHIAHMTLNMWTVKRKYVSQKGKQRVEFFK